METLQDHSTIMMQLREARFCISIKVLCSALGRPCLTSSLNLELWEPRVSHCRRRSYCSHKKQRNSRQAVLPSKDSHAFLSANEAQSHSLALLHRMNESVNTSVYIQYLPHCIIFSCTTSLSGTVVWKRTSVRTYERASALQASKQANRQRWCYCCQRACKVLCDLRLFKFESMPALFKASVSASKTHSQNAATAERQIPLQIQEPALLHDRLSFRRIATRRATWPSCSSPKERAGPFNLVASL